MGYSFPMIGGDGALSYTKNSQLQKEASDFAKPIIQEAIMQKLEVKIGSINNTVRIADLGCSVGPNTFSTVEWLIKAVEEKLHHSDSKSSAEFQVFFSDHSGNDFNTLFASLPGQGQGQGQYHAAGVPGSFKGRLFPRDSLTLAHSSYALHWLSRPPNSDKARIFYGREARDDAYWEQFKRDMGDFTSARAQEIVKGGLMFLSIPGVADGVAHAFATAFDLFYASLTDLAAQGIIGKGEIEGFKLPFYFPRAAEVAEVIEENGCFSVERVELMNPRSNISARAIINHLRAAFEGVFAQHFGDSVTDKMFTKTLDKAEEASQLLEADLYHSLQLFYVFKRK